MKFLKQAFLIQAVVLFTLGSLQASATTTTPEPIKDWGSVEEISAGIEFKLVPENGEVTYGPNFASSDQSLSDNFSEIYLTRLIDHEGADHYALYITAKYDDTDWRSYKDAVTRRGEKLPLVTLSKNENVCEGKPACRYEERLAIPLSFLYFFDGSTSGLNITISGNKTSEINLPAAYFRAMLQSIPEENLYEALDAEKEIAKAKMKEALN
ncbi:hypothetical protein LCGC14_2993510 [marine sediment metagenome]|uniref:Uncharacterized protein n=1 Tax=marine sediment metagenome TaxID=412755 RepID=A0A0F8ZAM5_9ZZZZ|nr:hypothetical protein [Porticoccus sp.]